VEELGQNQRHLTFINFGERREGRNKLGTRQGKESLVTAFIAIGVNTRPIIGKSPNGGGGLWLEKVADPAKGGKGKDGRWEHEVESRHWKLGKHRIFEPLLKAYTGGVLLEGPRKG